MVGNPDAPVLLPLWHNVRQGGWHESPLPLKRARLAGVPLPMFLSTQQFDIRFDEPVPTLQIGPRHYLQPPRHYASDGGSIPMLVQALVPALNAQKHKIVWLFHDGTYRVGIVFESAHLWGPFEPRRISRSESDELLRVGLIADGATEATARTAWLGVRAGGWAHYSPRIPASVARRCEIDADDCAE